MLIEQENNSDEYIELPLMSLREVVMFPHSIMPLMVGRENSAKAIESSLTEYGKRIMLITQKEADEENPRPDDLYSLGVVCKILQIIRLPDGSIKVLFEGLYRAEFKPVNSLYSSEPFGNMLFPKVLVREIDEIHTVHSESEALLRATHEALLELGKSNRKISAENLIALKGLKDQGRLADSVMPHLMLDYQKKYEVFEILDTNLRLQKTYELLNNEIELLSLEKNIKTRVKNQMERNQKEYYLNEQMKAIHKEMGREEDLAQSEFNDLEKRFALKNMPEEAKERAVKELQKLKQMSSSSPEFAVLRNYLDWLLDLPWNDIKETEIDIVKARTVLDNRHFGLKKVKERIIEYLAVQKLAGGLKGPILCLVGPPGVGKTSLARSVAEATGRDFVRLSLGGVRDEAEIRGHRRTYVGAMPGKILMSLKRTKTNNPLFCLDEIDKMTSDFRGDPSSALLEVLDPEQNYAFNDHYLDIDYDLSKIFFITTANSLHEIPEPLRDRMEILHLSSYIETEKEHIAYDFLLPKQIEQHGIKEHNLKISDNAMLEIIRSYTREAGVRSLEREIASICRKVAIKIIDSDNSFTHVNLTKQNLHNYLGMKKYRFGDKEKKSQIGLCAGLAYNERGGDILYVETVLMAGSGKIMITGQLGEVMKESANAAFSYIRSKANFFGLNTDFYKEIDIHVHVPEGATPKDGPSAGITIATSLASALLGIAVKNDITMTGEITLRGRVLAIGGLKEKLLAARRAGIFNVIVPIDNKKDVKEVPNEVTNGMNIHYVAHVDEVLPLALDANVDDIFIKNIHLPLLPSILRSAHNEHITQLPTQ